VAARLTQLDKLVVQSFNHNRCVHAATGLPAELKKAPIHNVPTRLSQSRRSHGRLDLAPNLSPVANRSRSAAAFLPYHLPTGKPPGPRPMGQSPPSVSEASSSYDLICNMKTPQGRPPPRRRRRQPLRHTAGFARNVSTSKRHFPARMAGTTAFTCRQIGKVPGCDTIANPAAFRGGLKRLKTGFSGHFRYPPAADSGDNAAQYRFAALDIALESPHA